MAELKVSPYKGTEFAEHLRLLLHTYVLSSRALGRRLDLGMNDLVSIQLLLGQPHYGQTELAAFLGISTASMAGLVDRLEERGLLARGPHPTDGRRVSLTVTDKAFDMMSTALDPVIEGEQEVLDTFDAAEEEIIRRFLGQMSKLYHSFALHPERFPLPEGISGIDEPDPASAEPGPSDPD